MASRISIPECVTIGLIRGVRATATLPLSFNTALPLVLAAHQARVFLGLVTLRMTEGAGKIGSWPLPWPACNKKRRRQVPQVRPGYPDLPCAMVLRLIRALPGDRLSCPRRLR